MTEEPGASRLSVRDVLAEQGITARTDARGTSKSDLALGLGAAANMKKSVFMGAMSLGSGLGQSLGVSDRKEVSRRFRDPYDVVLRATVMAISASKLGFSSATDTRRGAIIMAEMPSDIFSLGGQVEFDVVDEGDAGTTVEGAAKITGQMFAWGKGKRTLNAILDHAEQLARRL